VGESEKVSEKKPKYAQKYSNLLQQDTKYSISSQFPLKTTQINKALSPRESLKIAFKIRGNF